MNSKEYSVEKIESDEKRKDIFIKTLGILDYPRYFTLKKHHNTVIPKSDYDYAFKYCKKALTDIFDNRSTDDFDKQFIDIMLHDGLKEFCNSKGNSVSYGYDNRYSFNGGTDVKAATKKLIEYIISDIVGFKVVIRYVKAAGDWDNDIYIVEELKEKKKND